MNYGAVLVGYQGVGKSTLAQSELKFIDLESSNFFVRGKRDKDWYIPYCSIALDLASQGYIVFTSSHKEVRDFLINTNFRKNVELGCVVPSLSLKDLWIDKLWDRWRLSQKEKDFKAYANAQDRFEENVKEIKDSFNIVCELKSMNYDLKQEILQTLKMHGVDIGIFVLGRKLSV